MLRPKLFYDEIKRMRIQKMRMFNELLGIIKERYGEMAGLVLSDYVHIKLNQAEGLNFTDVQLRAMEDLVRISPQDVSYSYAS